MRINDLEIVVAGGGTAGLRTALGLARAGRSVAVVEARAPEEAGARWVNGVPFWCYEEARLPHPKAPERWHADDNPHHFVVGVSGGMHRIGVPVARSEHIDMRHLVTRLLEMAREAGVRFYRGRVQGLEMSGDRIVGVEWQGPQGRYSAATRLVVDATGAAAAVRRRVPAMRTLCPPVSRMDFCSAAQYQFAVTDADALKNFLGENDAQPGDSIAILGSAGGFSTLTLFTERNCEEVGILAGSITAMNQPSGDAMIRNFIQSVSWVGERRFGGKGPIPLRRPYLRLSAPGVALVGDAACQVYSAHGSGVGMGMIAARHLVDAVASAEDPGASPVLQDYERTWHLRHGGALAGSDAFRRFSQSLSNAELQRLFASNLLDEVLLGSGLNQKSPSIRPQWLLAKMQAAVRAPDAIRQIAPAVMRLGAAQGLMSVFWPESLRVRGAVDALLERVVAHAPEGA